MSDPMPVPDPLAALIAELREPVAVDSSSRHRLMELVRKAPSPTPAPVPAPRSRAVAAVRRMRGGTPRTSSAATLATAAGIALLLGIGAQERVSVGAPAVRRALIIGDSVASMASSIRDTLRIVQFMLTAPAASRVALAGDFNDWNPRATPLDRADDEGRWTVRLALAPGRHRYAYVVDDTQWVRDPAATAAEPDELAPPQSVRVVER